MISVAMGSEYLCDIDRNGRFELVPSQVNKYTLSIRSNNYVKIKASPLNCKLNLYNQKKERIATTSLIDFGYQGRLEDGNYYLSVEPVNSECKWFDVATQEEAFFTIEERHKDDDVLREEKRLTNILTNGAAEHVDTNTQAAEEQVQKEESYKQNQEHEAAKKALFEQMKR